MLELLWRLRQCIELARVISRRNKIIPRTLRGGTGEDRCGDFHKVQVVHFLAKLRHDLAAEYNLALHRGISKIQITVFQPRVLIRLSGLVDLKRKCIVEAFSQDFDLFGNDLDLAGRQFHVLAGALSHNPRHGNRGLLVHTVDDLHHLLGLHNHLRDSIKISDL